MNLYLIYETELKKRLLCIFVKTFALGKWKETKATVDGWKAEKNVT